MEFSNTSYLDRSLTDMTPNQCYTVCFSKCAVVFVVKCYDIFSILLRYQSQVLDSIVNFYVDTTVNQCSSAGRYRLNGSTLFIRQFWALFVKRFHYIRRSKKAFVSQVSELDPFCHICCAPCWTEDARCTLYLCIAFPGLIIGYCIEVCQIDYLNAIHQSAACLSLQIILPAIFICIAMVFSKINPPTPQMPPMEIHPWLLAPYKMADKRLRVFYS